MYNDKKKIKNMPKESLPDISRMLPINNHEINELTNCVRSSIKDICINPDNEYQLIYKNHPNFVLLQSKEHPTEDIYSKLGYIRYALDCLKLSGYDTNIKIQLHTTSYSGKNPDDDGIFHLMSTSINSADDFINFVVNHLKESLDSYYYKLIGEFEDENISLSFKPEYKDLAKMIGVMKAVLQAVKNCKSQFPELIKIKHIKLSLLNASEHKTTSIETEKEINISISITNRDTINSFETEIKKELEKYETKRKEKADKYKSDEIKRKKEDDDKKATEKIKEDKVKKYQEVLEQIGNLLGSKDKVTSFKGKILDDNIDAITHQLELLKNALRFSSWKTELDKLEISLQLGKSNETQQESVIKSGTNYSIEICLAESRSLHQLIASLNDLNKNKDDPSGMYQNNINIK